MDWIINEELIKQIEEFCHRVNDSQPEPVLRAQARQIIQALGQLENPRVVFGEIEEE